MLLLEIIRDGRRGAPLELATIGDDVQGNLLALEAMARIVREDATQPDLRAFVNREILAEVRGHQFLSETQVCFQFARDQIVYRRDPVGVERVVDLWSTMYALDSGQPEGDCGIKSVFLATCLALLGQTPFFVILSQSPDAGSYSHVYVGTIVGGQYVALDPTPESATVGYQAAAYSRAVYPIFAHTAGELASLKGS